MRQRNVMCSGDRLVCLQLWEVGSSDPDAHRAVYAGLHGALVLYSVASLKSFDSCRMWLENVDALAPPSVCKMLAAAKADDAPRVPPRDGEALALSMGLPFASVSARDGTGVADALVTLAEAMLEARERPTALAALANLNTQTPAPHRSIAKPAGDMSGERSPGRNRLPSPLRTEGNRSPQRSPRSPQRSPKWEPQQAASMEDGRSAILDAAARQELEIARLARAAAEEAERAAAAEKAQRLEAERKARREAEALEAARARLRWRRKRPPRGRQRSREKRRT